MKSLARLLLRSLARRVLQRYRPIVVGVAGSVGKTATKEAIAAALTTRSRTVRKTSGSFNAEIGVPTTILAGGSARTHFFGWLGVFFTGLGLLMAKKPYPQALVLEMGADKPGDLGPLIELVQPQYGVLTAMTAEHLEFFNSLEGVAAEESQLVTKLPPAGVAVMNLDDPAIAELLPTIHSKVMTFGWHPEATVQALSQSPIPGPQGLPMGMIIRISVHGVIVSVALPGVLGRHQVLPILAGIATALALGDDMEEVVSRLSSYAPPPHRMAALLGIHGTLLIDDCYNSSPAAVEAALETLADVAIPGKRYAILGQMSELGSIAAKAHETMGEHFRAGHLDFVALIGPFGEQIRAGASRAGFPLDRIVDVATPEAAAALFQTRLHPGDAILVKGSRYPKPGYAGHLEKAVSVLAAPAA